MKWRNWDPFCSQTHSIAVRWTPSYCCYCSCCCCLRPCMPLYWLLDDCIMLLRFMEEKKSLICCWTLPKARRVASITDRVISPPLPPLQQSARSKDGAARVEVHRHTASNTTASHDIFII